MGNAEEEKEALPSDATFGFLDGGGRSGESRAVWCVFSGVCSLTAQTDNLPRWIRCIVFGLAVLLLCKPSARCRPLGQLVVCCKWPTLVACTNYWPTLVACSNYWPTLVACTNYWPTLVACTNYWPTLVACTNYWLHSARLVTQGWQDTGQLGDVWAFSALAICGIEGLAQSVVQCEHLAWHLATGLLSGAVWTPPHVTFSHWSMEWCSVNTSSRDI